MRDADYSRSPGKPTTQAVPLSLLRIWCRTRDAWLSFHNHSQDRFLIGKQGYFLELPDGSLTPFSPRVAFPDVERFPSVLIEDIEIQRQFGPSAYFIYVPDSGPRTGKPGTVNPDDLVCDLSATMPWLGDLDPLERYVAARLYDSGVVPPAELSRVVPLRRPGRTFGRTLIDTGLCGWEQMLAACLDSRSATRLDPPALRALGYRKEWELTGEILLSMRKITRTQLESALKIKRDGSQALGQILTSMGACSEEDIEEGLRLQKAVREDHGSGVGLVGQLLVSQGVISPIALDEALRNQKVGRQSMESILIAMGACRQRDVDDFTQSHKWHTFQGAIDDVALGEWLLKIGTISRQQFNEAMRMQTRGRQVLGEMLVSMKFCTTSDIERMIKLQKDLRESYASGVERLGGLLVKQGKLDLTTLDRALSVQSIGRQPIGAILVAMNPCDADDVTAALDIQADWRRRTYQPNDRLGDVLVASGVITPEELAKVLPLHMESKGPLGRILVEQELVAPEQVIDALLERDLQRQLEFQQFLEDSMPAPQDLQPVEPVETRRSTAEIGKEVLSRLTSWVTKRPQ